MLIVLYSIAAAGEPNRCVAAWAGPVEGCNVRESFEIAGAGATAESAEKATREALAVALEKYGLAWRITAPLADPKELARCAELAAVAHAECFPIQGKPDPAYCFVQLDDATCWDGEVLNVEISAWKAPDAGRKMMCEAVDKRLVVQNYTDVDAARVKCQAACAARTKVNCPSQ